MDNQSRLQLFPENIKTTLPIKNAIADYNKYLRQRGCKSIDSQIELSNFTIEIVNITYDYVNRYGLNNLSPEDSSKVFCNMMHALKFAQDDFKSAIEYVKNVIEIFERKEIP